jgi:hypothetical protein
MDMRRVLHFLAFAALLLAAACDGGHPPRASTVKYTNPEAAPDEWRLVRDEASTRTHLVLDLMGPSDGSRCRGVGLTLQADPTKVRFGRFSDGEGKDLAYYLDGGVFLDKDDAGTDQPVALQAGGVAKDKLMVGIFQRKDDEFFRQAVDHGTTPKDCSQVVLKVAIDLDQSLAARPGSVPLTVLKARTIAEHVNANGRRMSDVVVKVGVLELK